jgi:hypothetical protein
MKKVFSEEENNKIDSATPCSTWKEFPPIDHCMSYNEPHTYGKLVNIQERAKKRNIKLYHAPKIWFKKFNNLDYIFEELESTLEKVEDPAHLKDLIEHLKELIEYDKLREIEDE